MFTFSVGDTTRAVYNLYCPRQKESVTLSKDSGSDSACHNNSTYFNP